VTHLEEKRGSMLYSIVTSQITKKIAQMPMKKMPPWQAIVSSVAVTVLIGACGQSQMSSTVPGTTAASVEQNTWKQLTADGDAAVKRGDKAEAEQAYKAAMTEAEKLGADNPAQAEAIVNLANFYYVQGAGDRADELYKKSLALHEKNLGKEHVDLVVDLVGLARVSSSQKKYADASGYYRRAIAILKKAGRAVPSDVETEYGKAQSLASGDNKQGS
jgi:tetratricopeptide (TPR) repeat protein